MKITVIVPSEQYLQTAGVRIRYKRISAALAQLGWTLDIVPIGDVPDLSVEDSRIYVLSKCQDARAVVLATAAKRAGIVVGIDLYDDYFSQEVDSRFATQRLWLQSMARETSFFLCSTARMLEVGEAVFGDGTGYVLGDPHEEFDPQRLAHELDVKIRKAKRERYIQILWFGIAENPSFPVGLHDLSAFAEALLPFQDNSYKATLTILTNKEGIDGQVLERLRRIPIPFVVAEWSKKREEEAFSRSLVSFLPVNYQPFSIAKSLNRGVSALVGGTQVLTAGYPLYQDLEEYVYCDGSCLIEDLENAQLKLSNQNIEVFSDWIGRQAAPATQALNLVKFLEAKIDSSPDAAVGDQQYAVLHGAKSTSSINNFAQRLKWLSLASPLLPSGMPCDAHLGFCGADTTLRLRVSQAGLEQLPEQLRVEAVWADRALGKGPSWEVPLASHNFAYPLETICNLIKRAGCADAAINTQVMKLTRQFFNAIFENLSIVEAEIDPVENIIRDLNQRTCLHVSR
ncbi:MAG: hypothetical protein ABIO43_03675 [Sphingomicrobium sp.]